MTLPNTLPINLPDYCWPSQFRAVVTDNAGNSSNTAAIAVIVDNTAPTAGTLSFANLTDSGHADTPTPITTDSTFDLSLSGDTDTPTSMASPAWSTSRTSAAPAGPI